MPWIQLKLNTTGANAEELSDALMEAGSVSITFQDTHDTPVFEPLPGETRLWGDTDVIGLFDAETDMEEVVAILQQQILVLWASVSCIKSNNWKIKTGSASGWITSTLCALVNDCGFARAGAMFRMKTP
ncbi:ribosomal protein L11 methyltransferase [Klebsiella michiganensis]|nr:ribosomal protein L11 methyltransferase [Klebsiella michiganensis]